MGLERFLATEYRSLNLCSYVKYTSAVRYVINLILLFFLNYFYCAHNYLEALNMSKDIDYGTLMHKAMRTLIFDVLKDVEKNGLPGEHHFFITFDTTCLLYTSPSPRDRQKSRMPSSA